MRKLLILLAAGIIIPASLAAFQGDYGTESVFSTGAGARAIGMGSAFTALSDDNSGACHNPAGAAFMDRQQALFMHYPLYEGAMFNSLSYGIPLLDFGTVGGSVFRMSAGEIEGYDPYDSGTGTFDITEYKGSIYYARLINEQLAAGARVSVFGLNVLDINSAGFGIDAGVIYRPVEFLSLGLVLENLIKPSLTLADGSEDMPQRYIGGVALNFAAEGITFILSADSILGEREEFKYRAGVELGWAGILALRAGIDDGQLVFGGGLSYAGVGINYAYINNEFLGGMNVFDVTYNFGMSIDEQKKSKALEIRKQVKKLVEERISGDMQAKADIFYEKAYAMFDNAKYEEALAELQKALEWYPKHWKAKRLKMWIKFRIRELYFEAAFAYYKKKNYISAIENFAILKKYDENYRDAVSYERSIFRKLGLSGRAEGYFSSGVAFYMKKEYNKAINQWQKALNESPGNISVSRYIEKAKKGTVTASKRKKREISADDRQKSENIYYKAVDAYTSGETEKAMRLWDEAISVNPGNISARRDMEKARIEIDELRRRGIE